MSQISGTLAKPQLRGLLHSAIKRNLIMLGVSCFTAACAIRIFINNPRKAVYAEFYKNYDIEKEFESMRKKGLFDSCPSE